MKTVTDWYDEEYENLHSNDDDIMLVIKQIQLDAWKQGVDDAIDVVERFEYTENALNDLGNLSANSSLLK